MTGREQLGARVARLLDVFEEVAGSGSAMELTLKMDPQGRVHLLVGTYDSATFTEEWAGEDMETLAANMDQFDAEGMDLTDAAAAYWGGDGWLYGAAAPGAERLTAVRGEGEGEGEGGG